MREQWPLAGPSTRWPSHVLVGVPLLLIAAVTVLDVFTPETIHLGPLLVAAPAVTASFAGPLLTGLMGACAVASQVLIAGVEAGGLTTANHQAEIWALVVVSLFLVLFRYSLDRRGRQLTQVRSVAEAAQQALLRPVPERLGPLRVASVYDAAEAEARIGGDLFAAVRAGHSTRLLIGDVRGKGLGAVADAALLLGAFRSAAHEVTPLPQLVEHLERTLSQGSDDAREDVSDDEPAALGESFVTAAVVEVPDDEPVLRLVNCGHPQPYLLSEGRVTPLEVPVPHLPLGLGLGGDSPARRPSPSARVTSWSSTPTGPSRRGPPTARSIRSPSAWPSSTRAAPGD